MIELRGVTKRFDGKSAVDGIDLEIPPGRVYGLIGPNGAGKTTTLRMLATLILPDEGRVRIAGLDLPDRAAEARRRIGYMPDRQGSFRGMTSLDYLLFFGRLHGLAGGALRGRIETILELTDMEPVRDEAVSALSLGMRQRLALAKTLLHDPEVLILDEPATGLDPRARIEIRALLKELGRMGKTVVVSSHILADLEEICTDVGIMEQGKLLATGPLDSIRASARTARRAVRLRVAAADRERALGALRRAEGEAVRQATPGAADGELRVEVDGVGGNAVLQVLIQEGIEILAFAEDQATLEAIFIDRTRGALQ